MTRLHVRRSRFLILHWSEQEAVVENYATGGSHAASPAVFAILDRAASWVAREDLRVALPDFESEFVETTIAELLEDTLLEAADRPVRERERALSRWDGWIPAAGYFHMATKDVPYIDPRDVERPTFVLRSYPPHLKTYPDAPVRALPSFPREGLFAEVLRERRTWRHFGDARVTLNELSTLLGLTWGIQMWAPLERGLRAPLKTSPSGGAKHSGEAYVLCWGVGELGDGTYHYCPDRHALTLLEAETPRELLETFIPGQHWFHRPSVVVFLTSVFERVHYKYRNSRAYRVVLLEAGHLAQTFCLTATWLGLAPFSTVALADSAIEDHLGLDGVTESVMYAVGVGSRPYGVDWPRGELIGDRDRMIPPVHERRPTAAVHERLMDYPPDRRGSPP